MNVLIISACLLGAITLSACAISPVADAGYESRSVFESMQLNNIGVNYMQRGDNYMAAICFEKALARQPNLAIAHLNLGLLYQNTGKLSEAQWQYHLAMSTDPMDKIQQPVESVPVEFDMRTVGEIAFHKMTELPQIFFAPLS